MLDHRGLLSLSDIPITQLRDFFRRLVQKRRDSVTRASRVQSPVGCLAFFENSTRTLTSFEKAGLDLGLRWIHFDPSLSSLSKGESLEESFKSLAELDPSFFVVRHSEPGFAHWVQHWTQKPVFNAGDGRHQHPTQALGDAWTLWKQDLKSGSVAFFGDVENSRVARSSGFLFKKLGYRVSVVNDGRPQTLLFSKAMGFRLLARDKLPSQKIVFVLRAQKERGGHSALGPLLKKELGRGSYWMHAGPVIENEDVEWALCRFEDENSLVRQQVRACYEVRYRLLADLFEGSR